MSDTELRRLAQAALRQHDYPEAARRLQKYLELHPGDDEARLELGLAALMAGDTDAFTAIGAELQPRLSGPAAAPRGRTRLQHLWEVYRGFLARFAHAATALTLAAAPMASAGCDKPAPDKAGISAQPSVPDATTGTAPSASGQPAQEGARSDTDSAPPNEAPAGGATSIDPASPDAAATVEAAADVEDAQASTDAADAVAGTATDAGEDSQPAAPTEAQQERRRRTAKKYGIQRPKYAVYKPKYGIGPGFDDDPGL